MNLRQQIVSDRVANTSRHLILSEDIAFLRFAHSLVVGQSIHAFDQADQVDGGQDKQIDTITIIQDDDEADIYILSMKNTESFSSNAIIQMRNGLNWIFNQPRDQVATLSNLKFRDKILEYRSVQSGLGPSNLRIVVAFITNGLGTEISDEFRQEERVINSEYNNGTFENFEFQVWGADELVEEINRIEKKSRRIDTDIRIRYDANNPSLIRYLTEGLKGLVCSSSAKEIADIVNNDTTGAVFDSNIRRFLGIRGSVNADILKTCSEPADSYKFWFLNNGITIVCDSFDAVTDPDHPHVKIKNMQIVNGCQTATALAVASKKNTLSADTRVLLRIYETSDSDLVDRIVQTTNNQNKISSRDLHSNDKAQLDMQEGFLRYKYLYERKPHQYDEMDDSMYAGIVPNEIVAQCYLAIVLRKPSDARRRKYKVWGELYSKIFSGSIIEPYVIAYRIADYSEHWLRRSGLRSDASEVKRKLANNGLFHLSRIFCYLLRKTESWSQTAEDYESLFKQFDDAEILDTALTNICEQSFEILLKTIKDDKHYLSDIDTAMKSTTLDSDIDRVLHSSASIT